MDTIHTLLNKLWLDYSQINTQAEAIFQLLSEKGETVVNDHIAFRTYNHPRVSIRKLARVFEGFGYVTKGEYEFPEKKLSAQHFEHVDSSLPRIFISELNTQSFSTFLQNSVNQLVEQVDDECIYRNDFVVSGRPWLPIPYSTYERLRAESEYAAWVAVFGFRANHFTVLVNSLKSFSSLNDLNSFLKDHHFRLNDSGGEIKGSSSVYLEQSSTLADPTRVEFADGNRSIPGCYYEFAKRYPLPNGKLFSGFVAKSADKIFESTHSKDP